MLESQFRHRLGTVEDAVNELVRASVRSPGTDFLQERKKEIDGELSDLYSDVQAYRSILARIDQDLALVQRRFWSVRIRE